MRRTLLVARREFVENLRTKTFWIGIFSLPVIFGLFIGVGRFLEGSKDVRTYAVLDLSEDQWLSDAVEARAAKTDLAKIVETATGESEKEREQLRQNVTEWFEGLPEDHPIRDLVRRLEPYVPDQTEALVAVGDADAATELPPAAQAEVLRWALEVQRDPAALSALRSMASGIAMSRYRELPVSELGVDASADLTEKLEALNGAIQSGRLFAYFLIPEEPVESAEGAEYVSNNATDRDLRDWFSGHATEVVREHRIDALNLTKAQAAAIQARFEFDPRRVTETGATAQIGDSERAASFAPVAFVYLLWIAVFTAAQMLLTNTVEEKSNRLIEVLLSSVSPMELMAGKVLGIAATGLTIVVSWVLTAIVGAQLIPDSSPLAELELTSIIGDPLYLASFVGYFLAGYLLFAAILVALGSVCDSLKEAQNLMQPVFILLIVPLVAMFFVVQDPNGTMARVLTYIPLYTPFLMMNRAGGPPPLWEYGASTALILVSLVIAFWGAAKIFRIGILMTGKPPRIKEILRWLTAPVGHVAVARVREPESPSATTQAPGGETR